MSHPAISKRQPLPSAPPEAWAPLLHVARVAKRPLERFLRVEAASGILLFVGAALALLCANSPWAEAYHHFWQTPVGIRIGGFVFERSLEWFVNDVLMVVFFFVVGLEIRREVYQGELSEWRRAALPAAAALGGMLAPAGIYLLLAGDTATRAGWGVPMATDIAFAVGILTLLGRRVPPALRVLLLALAVIDDLGAIVVIAVFYSSGVAPWGFVVAGCALLGTFGMQRLGIRSKAAYVVPGCVAWAGIYMAGVHPTIAGVIVGLMTPVRAWLGQAGLVEGVQKELIYLTDESTLSPHELSAAIRNLSVVQREAVSPSESLIETLHPWAAYLIMPVFALANAGVSLGGIHLTDDSLSAAVGVSVGLVAGKPIGVLLAIGLVLKLGIGVLPRGLSYRHLVVLGTVAGVGFTMALFIAQLAFTDVDLLAASKVGILVASGVAAALALVLGRLLLKPLGHPGQAETADEAEQSTEL